MMLPTWYRNALAASSAVAGRDVFFVLGCQKSGTTWVQNVLDAHPHVCCGGEGHFSDVAAPLIERAVDLYNEETRTGRTVTQEEMFSLARLFADQVLSGYLARCDDPSAIRAIGDKTPEGAIGVPALDTLYPGSKLIHVIRDGRDAAVSGWYQLRREGRHDQFEDFAAYAGYFARHHWRPYIERARQAAARMRERYVEVRYEELCVGPQIQTRRLLGFLGVEESDATVRACVEQASFRALSGGRECGQEDASSHFRKGIIGDWRNVFDEEAGRRFAQEAGSLLEELGYAEAAAVHANTST